METIPESATLSDDQWTFMIDLSTDRQKTVFGLGILFLLGTAVLFVFLIGVCLRRVCSCCKKTCRGYKLAATDSDRVTPTEWELQELNLCVEVIVRYRKKRTFMFNSILTSFNFGHSFGLGLFGS